MIRLVSKAAFLAVACLLAASITSADVPDKDASTIGTKILLIGHNGANNAVENNVNVIPYYTKQIIVRDAQLNLVKNCLVTLNFTPCYVPNGLRLGTIQPAVSFLPPGQASKTVTAITGYTGPSTGIATFAGVCGGGSHTSGLADAEFACIEVKAAGVPLGFLYGVTPDQNGLDCYNVSDFGLFANDYNAGYGGGTPDANYRNRSDMNQDGPRIPPAPGPNNQVADFGLFANCYNNPNFGGGGGAGCLNGGSTGPMIP